MNYKVRLFGRACKVAFWCLSTHFHDNTIPFADPFYCIAKKRKVEELMKVLPNFNGKEKGPHVSRQWYIYF